MFRGIRWNDPGRSRPYHRKACANATGNPSLTAEPTIYGLTGLQAAAPPEGRLRACRACGEVQALPAPRAGYDRKCGRCGETLGSGLVHLEFTFPLLLAITITFITVLSLPLLQIELQGQHAEAGLMTGVSGFLHYGMAPMALFAFAGIVFAPLGRVAILLFAMACVVTDRRPKHLARLCRFSETLRPWAMLDVFLVGALISITKLRDLVRVEMAPGLWVLMGLVWSLALFDSFFDRHRFWDYIDSPADVPAGADAINCIHCNLLQEPAAECRRCGAHLHRRKPESVQITWALVISGVILYIPANLYPVFTIVSFGRGNTSTILGGVRQLLTGSDWPLAIIIFVASIVVPMIKLIGLGWLLIAVRRPQPRNLRANTRLHRLIEVIGRWSATDVFVAALLSGLVMLDNLATVVPGPGVLAFGAVVFLTMVATATFDQRLLWDAADE
jgi:paraquat-inducible protein A